MITLRLKQGERRKGDMGFEKRGDLIDVFSLIKLTLKVLAESFLD